MKAPILLRRVAVRRIRRATLRIEIFLPFIWLISIHSSLAFDAAKEEAKLLQRDAEWADLATAGKDVDRIVSYWSDDAMLIMPGQPTIEGKAAIRAYVASCLSNPIFKIHWKSSKVIFSPDGKMAYMPATDEMTVPGPNGAPMTLHLRGIAIWRVESDGQWRCVVDIANEEPPAK